MLSAPLVGTSSWFKGNCSLLGVGLRLPISTTMLPLEKEVLALKCGLPGWYPAGRINKEGILFLWTNMGQLEVCLWEEPHPLLSWVGWKA